MAVDERNFRSAYYEKVGFKNVEEKRSLEILLKEKQLDLTKLRQFCLRFCVPVTHRNLVWKILLGVLPVQENCHIFITEQRKEEVSNLFHALDVMRVTKDLPKSQVFVAMLLLQAGKLHCDCDFTKEYALYSIVKTMMFYFDSNVDIYWITRAFYENVQKFLCEIPKLKEASYTLLEKEDQQLYKHLIKIDALESLPLDEWFDCCFSGILNDLYLCRIWDKVVAGSYKILIYLTVVLLTSLKLRLMKSHNSQDVLLKVQNISEEVSEAIINKSIELWQQQGSPQTVYDKPKP